MVDNDSNRRVARRLRWWPAALIVGLASAALAYIWLAVEGHRQRNVMLSAPVIVLTILLLVLWLLFLSRLRVKNRLLWLLALLAGFGGLASTVTVRGVSGDLVPVLGWRFGRAPGELAAPVIQSAVVGGNQAEDGILVVPSDGTDLEFWQVAAYPQYLGPQRNATVDGPTLARDWKASPPELLWRRPVGAAWSGFAIKGDYAVTQEQRGDTELVTAYDLLTGELRWSHENLARHEDPLGGIGPRATPSLTAGRVYAQGATGILNVLDLQTGSVVWSTNVLDDGGAHRPEYGLSTSPLLLPDALVVFAGGGSGSLLIAYERETGRILWKAGDDPGSYSSPALLPLAGRDQIVVLGSADLSAHDLATGAVLWEFPWATGSPRAAQPVVIPGDRLLISSGYGVGSTLLRISSENDAWDVETVWESRDLKAKFSNVVYREGYVYGLDDGILVAVDVETGKRAWKRGRYGHGQLILAGDLLVVQSERGDVALVEATPAEHRELSRLEALGSKTWNHPALAGPYLIVRNDRQAACYRLR